MQRGGGGKVSLGPRLQKAPRGKYFTKRIPFSVVLLPELLQILFIFQIFSQPPAIARSRRYGMCFWVAGTRLLGLATIVAVYRNL